MTTAPEFIVDLIDSLRELEDGQMLVVVHRGSAVLTFVVPQQDLMGPDGETVSFPD